MTPVSNHPSKICAHLLTAVTGCRDEALAVATGSSASNGTSENGADTTSTPVAGASAASSDEAQGRSATSTIGDQTSSGDDSKLEGKIERVSFARYLRALEVQEQQDKQARQPNSETGALVRGLASGKLPSKSSEIAVVVADGRILQGRSSLHERNCIVFVKCNVRKVSLEDNVSAHVHAPLCWLQAMQPIMKQRQVFRGSEDASVLLIASFKHLLMLRRGANE